ncbi:hypothetical protein ACU4GD_10100 [Cupriavidus basilensis]
MATACTCGWRPATGDPWLVLPTAGRAAAAVRRWRRGSIRCTPRGNARPARRGPFAACWDDAPEYRAGALLADLEQLREALWSGAGAWWVDPGGGAGAGRSAARFIPTRWRALVLRGAFPTGRDDIHRLFFAARRRDAAAHGEAASGRPRCPSRAWRSMRGKLSVKSGTTVQKLRTLRRRSGSAPNGGCWALARRAGRSRAARAHGGGGQIPDPGALPALAAPGWGKPALLKAASQIVVRGTCR